MFLTIRIITVVLISILVIVPLSTVSVKASDEDSYRYGYMKGYPALDPQNSPTANEYPELKNDTCALSSSYKYGNGIVIPAVTNTTSCLDGFFRGWKSWCSDIKHAVGCIGNLTLGDFPDTLLRAHQQYLVGAKVASNVSSPICPLEENAAYCLGWANNNTFEDEGCADEPTANITRDLIGCIGDSLTESQIGGLPTLVGNWHFVNETETDNKQPTTGTFLFNNDGYMRMVIPNKSGLGSYVQEESWGYFGHRVLTFCNGVGCQNSTLTIIMPNHIEFVDSNNNTVHLMRFHPSPSSVTAAIATAHPQDISSNNVTILSQSGQTQANLQNYTGALALYKKALTIDPQNDKVLADMGRVLDHLHNYTGAIQSLNKALAVNSSNTYVLEYKGFLLYGLEHYRESLVYFNRALELDLSSYDMLNNKGLVLMKLGDYSQAISTFDMAIYVQPYEDLSYYYKALALKDIGLQTHNVGEIKIALKNVNKALSLWNDNKDMQQNLKLSLEDLLAWSHEQL